MSCEKEKETEGRGKMKWILQDNESGQFRDTPNFRPFDCLDQARWSLVGNRKLFAFQFRLKQREQ